ncbi:hypothetical protein GBAR_LOCUS5841 [Geodia barretti]|uniref:Uncharacterized protein n=1 Tax=Geodia barretti TaxID=519541 RepID=A0AA35RBS6_GEOBA|nr:hypothetical protein GBAR_LOCUS5841 [Geodia barretti]
MVVKQLWHTSIGIIFCYILKTLVQDLYFLTQKLSFSFVNAIIQFSYKAVEGEKSISTITKDDRDSLSKGMITENLLKHKNFTEYFVPGLYEACHAIEIFKKLYTIAEGDLGSDQESGRIKYIMMCLLPRLSVEKLKPLQKFKETQPLLLQFGTGSPPKLELCCSPSGSFGNTIACLITKHNWIITTDLDDKGPECLYHDAALLHPNEMSAEVALINKTEYFEVYVDLKMEHESQIFAIRRDISEAVKSVLEKMNRKLGIFEGFNCTCGRKKLPHTQYIKMEPETCQEYVICRHSYKGETKPFWIKAQLKSSTCMSPDKRQSQSLTQQSPANSQAENSTEWINPCAGFALRRSNEIFVGAVDPENIVPVLYSKRLLTKEEKQKATQQSSTACQRLEEIFKAMERRVHVDPQNFNTLLQALSEEPATERCR